VGTVNHYDPRERDREKQASRDEDARALSRGEKTRAELGRENTPFAAAVRSVDFSTMGLPGYRRHEASDAEVQALLHRYRDLASVVPRDEAMLSAYRRTLEASGVRFVDA